MYCRNCNKKVRDNDKFCPYCGNKIMKEWNTKESSNIYKDSLDSEVSEKRRSGKGKRIFLLLGVIVVIAAVAIAGKMILDNTLRKFQIKESITETTGISSSIDEEDKIAISSADDKETEMISTVENKAESYYLAPVKNTEGKWGYIDETGKEVIECQYDDARSFSFDGFAEVKQNGKWGFIDRKGNEVIKCQYDEVEFFSENSLTAVQKDGLWGYIDKNGTLIIQYQYAYAWPYDKNGLAPVKNTEGKWGYINENGEEIISCDFLNCGGYFSDNGWVSVENADGKWGYINEEGEKVTSFDYRNAYAFSKNGFAAVENENEKWGYINEKEEVVIPFIYDQTRGFNDNGIAIGYRDGFIEIIHDGSYEIPWKIEKLKLDSVSVSSFNDNNIAVVLDDKTGKCGAINEEGNLIIPLEYDNIYENEDMLCYRGGNGWIITGTIGDENTISNIVYFDKDGKNILKLPDIYVMARAFS